MNTFRTLYGMLESSERRRAWMVFCLTLLMAFVEALGVASIMPFIAVLAKPEVVETNRYLFSLYEWLNFSTRNQFLIFLGIATLFLLIGSIFFRGLALWVQLRFTNIQSHKLACRLVKSYLTQPYHWFLNRHSSHLAVNVLAEVGNVIYNAYFPAMVLIANVMISIFLLAILVTVDPVLSTSMAGVLGGAYLTIFLIGKRFLGKLGEERLLANRNRHHILNEIFGGIKDVKISGLEYIFLDRFRDPSQRMARSTVMSEMIGEFPSLAMQALIFGGMLLVLLYLMVEYGGLQGALPLVALYALAAYRLMPALQGIYRNLAQLRVSMPAAMELHRDLHLMESACLTDIFLLKEHSQPLGLKNYMELRDIEYVYPNAAKLALDHIQLEVPAFSTIGLVGATGSGKTTLVDVILGLLSPASGQIIVDDQVISPANVRAWQRSLGYVPQNIFLSDDTVAANIAFGLPSREINMTSVEQAARIANLHDFVINELPDGYATRIGERGVRLSGGQRQRIGIARALYHDPEVLIFDEATSALDNVTEQAVMEAIYQLGRKKTIILIAHRLSTVRVCDRIYLLDQGRIIAAGTYEELLSTNERFRAMATQGVAAHSPSPGAIEQVEERFVDSIIEPLSQNQPSNLALPLASRKGS